MRTSLKTILTIIILTYSACINAQVDTKFWFAAPDIIAAHGDYPVFIRVTALDESATVTISLPAENKVLRTFTVDPYSQESTEFTHGGTYDLDDLENSDINTVNQKGILITSTSKITAYYDVIGTRDGENAKNPDRFTLKGENALGTEFFVSSQNDYKNASNYEGYEQVNFVATEDGTVVNVTPTVDVEGHSANVTFSVSLNEGETYTVKGNSKVSSYSLAGTHIKSNNAIAVTISDDCVVEGSASDLIGDQTIPVSVCGMEYVAMFSGKENNGSHVSTEKIYILATNDNTTITYYVSDTSNSTEVIDAGETINLDIENMSSIHIIADAPVYVYQMSGLYKTSDGSNELGSAILPPILCTGSSSVSFTRVLKSSFYVQVLTKKKYLDFFTFDGTGLSFDVSDWVEVPGNEDEDEDERWYFTNQSLDIGTTSSYTLSNSNGLFHISIFDENSSSASFGYFSAFNSLAISGIADACEGDAVTLTATEDYGSYEWYSAASQDEVLSNEQVLEVTESGKYWVVAVKDENGSESCVLADTIDVAFEMPEFTLDTLVELCANDSYTITPKFAENDTESYTFEWVNGTDISNEATYTYTPSRADTTVEVYVTVYNEDGCSVTDTVSITVFPDVDIEFDINNSNAELCYGSTLRNTTTLYDYEWRYGSSSSSTIISSSSSVTVYNEGWYYLTASNDEGCYNTDSIYVTVNSLPTITLSDATLCHDEIYTSPTNSDSYSYYWTTKVSNITSETSSISISKTDSVYVTFTDTNTGCSNTDEAYIYFRPETTVADTKVTICAYTNYTFTASSSIVGNYAWSYEGTDLVNATSSLTLTNVLESQAGTYTVTGVDSNGCNVTQKYILIVNTGASITLGDDREICEGDSAQLTIGSVVASSYNWYFNENPEESQNGTAVYTFSKYYVKDAGIYYIKATTSNGCSSVDSVEVTVDALPDVKLEDLTAQCQNTSYVYDAGSGFSTFEWQDGSTGQTYTATQPQEVSVLVSDGNGCMNADTVKYSWKDVTVLSDDTIVVCPEVDYTISTTNNLSDISWYFNDGSVTTDLNNSTSSYSITDVGLDDAGSYIVYAQEDGCMVYDTTYFYVVDAGSINLGEDRTICQGEVIQLNANEGFTSYEWYLAGELDIQSEEAYVNAGTDLGSSETWTVYASYNYGECELEASVVVDKLSLPELTLQDYMQPCSGDTVALALLVSNVSTNSNLNTGDVADTLTYYWNGSSQGLALNDIFISKTGSYTLEVANNQLTSTGDTLHCYINTNTEAAYHELFTMPSLSDELLCPEETTTLDAPNSVVNYSDLESYQWVYLDDSGTATDSCDVSSSWENVSKAGDYVLKVQYTDSLCFASDTLAIGTKDTPEVAIEGDNIICSGDTTIFSTSTGYLSYLWSTGATTESIEANEAGDYSITITGQNSCENTATTTLLINELPTISLASSMIGLCNNSTAEIEVSSVIYSDNTEVTDPTYEWSNWETTSSIVVDAEGEYTVTATDENGCSGNASASVSLYPETTIDLSSIPTKGCTNEGILLECPFSISEITSYQWTKSGGSDNTPDENSDWTVYESGTYVLTVVDANLCETSDSVTIRINTSPVLDLGDDITVCISSTFEISGSTDYTSYLWSTGDTTSTINISASGENDYLLKVTNSKGCADLDTISVTTNPLPLVSITQPETVCAGTKVELLPQITSTTDYSLWWSTNTSDETISVSKGTYSITVTDNETGCSNSTSVTVNTYDTPEVSLGDDQYLCPLVDTLYISPEEGDIFSAYLWHNDQTAYEILADIGQINSVTVTDENGCTGFDQVVLKYLIYSDTTMNFEMCQQDTTISLLDIDLDADSHTGEYYWYTDGSTEDYYTFTTSDTVRVSIGLKEEDGENTCYYKQDTIIMEFYPLPVITSLDTIIYKQVTIDMDDLNPPYSYSMDSVIWQDENTFKELEKAEEYTVYVLDSNSCSTSQTFTLSDGVELTVPEFFTPNSDGYNDTWNIDGIERLPESVIRIYNRYGKLLAMYTGEEDGWDGTYVNKPMPVTDYWYVVDLKPINKLLKGHFTLKR